MRGTVTKSSVAGILLLTAACSSSGTAGSTNTASGSKPGFAGGMAPAPTTAEQPDGTADPVVCATLTGKAADDENAYQQHVATMQHAEIQKGIADLSADVLPLEHQAKGPLSFLVSALVIDTANDKRFDAAGNVPILEHNKVFQAIRTACDAKAANIRFVAVCDKLEQDWVAAADAVLAAKDDDRVWSGALHRLADQAAADVAPVKQNKEGGDTSGLQVAVGSLDDNVARVFDQSPDTYTDIGTETYAIALAGACMTDAHFPYS